MIYKIKNPVEYSFYVWMKAHPDSRHWKDTERFYSFVKTVCKYNSYNSKNWKTALYFKKRVLQEMPHFDEEYLDHLQNLFMWLIDFYKTPQLQTIGMTDKWTKPSLNEIMEGSNNLPANCSPSNPFKDCYVERQVKDGQFIDKLVVTERVYIYDEGTASYMPSNKEKVKSKTLL